MLKSVRWEVNVYRRILLCLARLMLITTLSTFCLGQEHGVIFLVRHAEKVSDAKDALLSSEGHKRAECLAHLLGDAGIRSILVTRVVRTQQTAEPLAKKSGLAPTVLDADDVDAFVKRLRAMAKENVLVVGHADTLPKIIERLGGGKITPIELSDYDKLFVFHYDRFGNKGSVILLHYCDCK